MLLHPLFAYPSRTHFVRKAHDWVRIPRPEVGKRPAQRGIFQTQGEGILAKGEIPVLLLILCTKNLTRQYEKHRCNRIGVFRIGDPYEESHPAMQAVRLALRVRICREAVGERLAQRADLYKTSTRQGAKVVIFQKGSAVVRSLKFCLLCCRDGIRGYDIMYLF